MAPNLPQPDRPPARARVPSGPTGAEPGHPSADRRWSAGWRSPPLQGRHEEQGDQLHAAQGCPREDQRRRRRRRRGPHPQGPAARPRRRGGRRRRTGAASRRCCPRSASPAASTRSPRCPPAGVAPLPDAGPRRAGRRRRRSTRPPAPRRGHRHARGHQRRVRRARPARRGDEHRVRAVVEGSMLGRYAFTTYKSGPAPHGPGEVVVLTDTARTKAAQHALAGRHGRRRGHHAGPRLGQHPARRPDPGDLRRRGRGRAQGRASRPR